MIYRKFLYVCFLLIISGTLLFSQENYRVADIEFAGNDILTENDLLDEMSTKAVGWFSRNIMMNDAVYFSRELIEVDLENIRRLYQTEGFLNVDIKDPDLIVDEEDKTVKIFISLTEGEPVNVENVLSIISDYDPEEKNLVDSLWKESLSEIKLVERSRFRDEDLLSDENLIASCYLSNGYPYISVNYELNVRPESNKAGITWLISCGPRSKYGKITLTGNKRIISRIITGKYEFQEGNYYNLQELNRTQTNLYDTGLFYNVRIRSLLNQDPKNIIPVEISVTEAPALSATLGVGYGRDEKFRVQTTLGWHGVLGGPGRLNLEAKHSALLPLKLRLIYTHPDFLIDKLTFITNISSSRENEIAYKLKRQGINLSLQRSVFKKIFAGVTFTIENIDLDTTSISSVNYGEYLLDNYLKSTIGFGLNHNVAEPYLSPKTGSQQAFYIYYSGLGQKSSYNYLKSILDLRHYLEFAESLVLALRISFGSSQSYDEHKFIPVEDRFYSGGSNSIRGWGRKALGPFDDFGKPIGGRSQFEGAIEFRYPILQTLFWVAFMDYGNVWLEEYTYKFNDLRYAAGLGVRYDTPIGPIRLDLARPIFEGKQKYQFWFSVGHAF